MTPAEHLKEAERLLSVVQVAGNTMNTTDVIALAEAHIHLAEAKHLIH